MFANNAKIGVLAIDCDRASASGDLFNLLASDQIYTPKLSIQGNSDSLSTADLQSVLARLRDQRVACIARRVADMVPAAIHELELRYPGLAITAGDALGEIRVSGQNEMTAVWPFRPTADALWQLRHANRTEKLNVIHPENVPGDPRVRAVRWLCLPIELEIELQSVNNLWV